MKKKLTVIFILFVILALFAAVGMIVFKKFAPSFTQRPMSEQYKIGKEETLLIVNGRPVAERGKLVSGVVYVPVEIAVVYMNERIYWDDKEDVLCLATSGGLITVNMADSLHYTLGKETKEMPYQVLYQDGEITYVAMEFVAQYSRINYSYMQEPNRILVQSDFESSNTFAVLADDIRLRVGPNKKYDYLMELEKAKEVLVDTSSKAENGYQKIFTLEGIEGYVPEEYLTKKEDKPWTTEKQEDIFPQIKMDKTICLGWHQMTGVVGSADFQLKTSQAASLNVISPTWFALSDNKGNISSLASTDYVTAAHAKGMKVWGLVNDFDEKKNNINIRKILGRTSVRANLVNNLVTTAMRYELDGINVDFEKITEKTAPAYLEFLRELVLACHANNIVVSVDDYLPTESSSFYDWAEQGKVVDYVIFMAYDEHYSGSKESGSVSSLPFVKNGVELGLKYIPPERVVVALPFYTRLWKETRKGKLASRPEVYGMSSAESLLQSHGVNPEWDEDTGQYYAEYKADNHKYRIWLEEETSLEKKLEVVFNNKAAAAGVSIIMPSSASPTG